MPTSFEEIYYIDQLLQKKKIGSTFRDGWVFNKLVGKSFEINTRSEQTGHVEKSRMKWTRKSIQEALEVMRQEGYLKKGRKGFWVRAESVAGRMYGGVINGSGTTEAAREEGNGHLEEESGRTD